MTLDSHTLSVGEVSAQTGLTVRTLHHYDELGLLTPQERTHAGHRRYGPGDVERLYRIVALRRLGLSLDEVAAVLDGATLEAVVRDQIEAPDERRLDAARERMAELLEAFHGGDPSIQRSLQRMWSEEDPAELSRGTVDRELAGYMGAVMRADRAA